MPPELTDRMIKAGQVWVWINDEPIPMPEIDETWPIETMSNRPGHWEVRGTGVTE